MANFQLYGTGLTVANQGAPTVNPFSSDWPALGKKYSMPGVSTPAPENCKAWFHFIPSIPGADFVIRLWLFNPKPQAWTSEKEGAQVSFPGDCMDYILDPINGIPIYPEIVSITGGATLTIYADTDTMEIK